MADDTCLFWHANESLVLPDGTRLSAQKVRGDGLRIDNGSELTLRFRQGGERCQPAGRDRSNSLKKNYFRNMPLNLGGESESRFFISMSS